MLADHWRRRDAERRALAAYADEAAAARPDDGALLEAVCGCVTGLVGTLKPELADIIRASISTASPLRGYAAGAGITANNAAVRLHRARQALGRQLRRTCAAGSIAALRDCTATARTAPDGRQGTSVGVSGAQAPGGIPASTQSIRIARSPAVGCRAAVGGGIIPVATSIAAYCPVVRPSPRRPSHIARVLKGTTYMLPA